MDKPLPRKQRVLNRGYLYSRSGENIKNPEVTLIDIDSSILFYFDKVIQPSVEDNGENVKVPIMYASPERWNSIKKQGFMRDKKRQVITPVVVYRRTSVTKDEAVPQDKLDANNPHMFYTFQKKFSQENKYDKFSQQIGLLPQREYYNVMMPDYVTISYDFIIWTSYIEQMNSIVEKIVYSDGAYWGDPEKMRFRSSIDSFEDATEIGDTERLVRTNFSVTLRGYLLPKGNFDHRSTTQKFLTPKKVIFGAETVDNITKNIGRSGQFQDELPEETTIGSVPSVGDLGITLTNPIVFNAGTGVTLSADGAEFDGGSRITQTISIGQDVSSTSNVVFNSVSASSLILGSTTFNDSQITGSITFSDSLTLTNNLTIDGNATVDGTLTVRELHTEFVSASIIYESGSTQFGDTADDTHQFSGSVLISGSFSINNQSVTEISDDVTLADNSNTALVTENAVKSYVNTNVIEANSYLRKQFFKTSNSITIPSTASFNAVTASAPTGLTATSKNDFVFFINGQYMEHDALSIQQVGSTFKLIINNDSIGYDLETDDEILAIGKFNS
jgi:ethanolamine utilization microcompartment shell protein EutS|tara:strand:+ start:705 stop:2381 length:1677 start_codon:yes stop_codon:yes gene_type:complete